MVNIDLEPFKGSKDRLVELLLYSSTCFGHCTNPFDSTHLSKKDVTAEECVALSNLIGSIIDSFTLMDLLKADPKGVENLVRGLLDAEKQFQETQK